MTLFVILLLAVAALVLARWRRLRAAAPVPAILAALGLFGIGCGPGANWLAESLQVPYARDIPPVWAARNAIVVLGAGTVRAGGEMEPAFFMQGRLLRAAVLYRDCKHSGGDCKLLLSGGDAQGHHVAEAVVYAGALRALGVPGHDLLLEPRSTSTWQNAQFSRPLLAAYAPQRIVLVSSAIHLRRSLLYFAHFGVVPQPVHGDYVKALYSPLPLGWNFSLADAALHEYIGLLRYRYYGWRGLNAPKAPPLATPPVER
ncbi:YdcF family protein [Frateuria defendens]|uniref:YdcF family protein n=1 Tax=Frateuria defendens TaxID=2219559 RepID=UPI00066FEAA9|nr:YdcF family protein [Frateuria defendens]